MARINGTATEEIMELLMQTGVSENMAQVVQLLVNEAMRMERTGYLNALPYERTPERVDHANGYPKRLKHGWSSLNELSHRPETADFTPL